MKNFADNVEETTIIKVRQGIEEFQANAEANSATNSDSIEEGDFCSIKHDSYLNL